MRGSVVGRVSSNVLLVSWDIDDGNPPVPQCEDLLLDVTGEAIVGYAFVLMFENGDTRETQLQGVGGAIGNGCLNVQVLSDALGVCNSLLSRVRRELERDGYLVACNDASHDEEFRTEKVVPSRVVNCIPLFRVES